MPSDRCAGTTRGCEWSAGSLLRVQGPPGASNRVRCSACPIRGRAAQFGMAMPRSTMQAQATELETMTLTATQPHKIYLAGKWVDSPDPLEVSNPANPQEPAGATYHATPEQYDEAVQAAVAAFQQMR